MHNREGGQEKRRPQASAQPHRPTEPWLSSHPASNKQGNGYAPHPRENAPGADLFHGLKVGSPWDCAFSEIVQDAGPENLLGTCRPRLALGTPTAPVRSAARPGRRAATMGRKSQREENPWRNSR